jgi:hypothetical protein
MSLPMMLIKNAANMNRMKSLLLILAVVGSACSDDNSFDPEKQQTKWLTSDVWVVDRVENDADGDLTFQYPNFAIAFVDTDDNAFSGEYYVTGGGKIFLEGFGKWRFSDDQQKIILQNGREMEVVLSRTLLTLSFFADVSSGRTDGVSGNFTFKLKKKSV